MDYSASDSEAQEKRRHRCANRGRFAVIIELKLKNENETLEDAANRALEQIENKQYAEEFHQRNISNILNIGIGFYGKTFAVVAA